MDDIFSVTFEVDGANAHAAVELLMADHGDEAEVITIALHTLHRTMEAWGCPTEDRRTAARDPVL